MSALAIDADMTATTSPPPRILAIGDIHGCATALEHLLHFICPTAQDTLVLLGDIVDCGPDAKRTIDQLLQISAATKTILILGNHEEMMRGAISGTSLLHTWLDHGGRETLASYGGSIDNIPASHLRFILTAQPWWETETEIFVHANLERNVSPRNQSREYLRWKHLAGSESLHHSGKRVICGHTPQKDGVPLILDGWVCLDTFAVGGGYLSCLDVASNWVYQASETGNTRKFPLSRYEVPRARID